jgi:uncharacterized membrane protein
MKQSAILQAIRWTARITGTGLVLFFLTFIIGSIQEGIGKPSPSFDPFTILIFVIWGVGLTALIVAWWKEGLGGWISFLCFMLFNILTGVIRNPGANYTYLLLSFLLPSVLYILYWYLSRKAKA